MTAEKVSACEAKIAYLTRAMGSRPPSMRPVNEAMSFLRHAYELQPTLTVPSVRSLVRGLGRDDVRGLSCVWARGPKVVTVKFRAGETASWEYTFDRTFPPLRGQGVSAEHVVMLIEGQACAS